MAFSAGFRNIGETDADFYADFTGGDSSFSGYRYVDLVLNGNRAYNIRLTVKIPAGGYTWFVIE